LKIVKSVHLDEKSGDEIGYTNAYLKLGNSHVTKYKNF